jgi:hypothetical protein
VPRRFRTFRDCRCVEVAFGRQRLGEQDVVRFQLDMVVLDRPALCFTQDAGAVDQQPGRDQHAIKQHRMVRGNAQVATWHAVGDGIGSDQDRLYLFGCRMTVQIDVPMTDPTDWPRAAAQRPHIIADRQVFHRDFAVVCPKPRAVAVAWRRRIVDREQQTTAGAGGEMGIFTCIVASQ